MKLLKALLRLVCFHRTVSVIRWHASCVTPDMEPKLLYVDRHKVHNFVRCTCCGHIFHTKQQEKLFDTQEQA